METYVYGNAGHITSHRICEGYSYRLGTEIAT